MRTTVDIPDSIYRELKSRAAIEGTTVKELILQGVTVRLQAPKPRPKTRRLTEPIVNTGVPGSLKLDNERIYDLIGFP